MAYSNVEEGLPTAFGDLAKVKASAWIQRPTHFPWTGLNRSNPWPCLTISKTSHTLPQLCSHNSFNYASWFCVEEWAFQILCFQHFSIPWKAGIHLHPAAKQFLPVPSAGTPEKQKRSFGVVYIPWGCTLLVSSGLLCSLIYGEIVLRYLPSFHRHSNVPSSVSFAASGFMKFTPRYTRQIWPKL